MSPPTHNNIERESGERWLENTIWNSEGPKLPTDLPADIFLDAFTELLCSAPGKAVLNALQKVSLLHGLRIAIFLYQCPPKKVQSFLWKTVDQLSDREIARRLEIDHKTVAAWCREITQALADLYPWGERNNHEHK